MGKMICGLCRSEAVNLPEVKEGRFYHCEQCDLIFKDKKHLLSPAEEKERYTSHNNTLENDGYVAMLEKFIRSAVTPFVKPGTDSLDFGCGPGPVLQSLLQKRGFPTDIYDPYFAANKPVNKYGLITCTEVLEHIHNPTEVWETFCSLLEEDGILSLMTHFHPGPESFAEWWYKKDPTHICFYSMQTFQRVEEQFPLRILYTDKQKTLTMKKVPML